MIKYVGWFVVLAVLVSLYYRLDWVQNHPNEFKQHV